MTKFPVNSEGWPELKRLQNCSERVFRPKTIAFYKYSKMLSIAGFWSVKPWKQLLICCSPGAFCTDS